MPYSLLFIFGTRPEAIKLCPVVRYMNAYTPVRVRVCVTAQHRGMLDQVLEVFGVKPEWDLGAMRPGQTLLGSTSRILEGLDPVVTGDPKPSMIVVQGDTTTTLCGALAGFYAGIPVAHVEAGLRTGDLRQPFPEEMNRVLVTKLSSLHLAATQWAADNLLAERVDPAAVHVTGNTGVDAVVSVASRLANGSLTSPVDWNWLDPGRKLIVVTAHRRESWGEGLERICDALLTLARRGDTQIVYPVHPNPHVSRPVRERLAGCSGIVLTEPLDYVGFVDLMRRATILLTDSGGVQEEAPSLGKPVLVMREKTERPEAVAAGTTCLVGSDTARVVAAAERLLDDPAEYARRSRIYNPYGDGRASGRVSAAICAYLGLPAESDTR